MNLHKTQNNMHTVHVSERTCVWMTEVLRKDMQHCFRHCSSYIVEFKNTVTVANL